jgi:hypothetical protein
MGRRSAMVMLGLMPGKAPPISPPITPRQRNRMLLAVKIEFKTSRSSIFNRPSSFSQIPLGEADFEKFREAIKNNSQENHRNHQVQSLFLRTEIEKEYRETHHGREEETEIFHRLNVNKG